MIVCPISFQTFCVTNDWMKRFDHLARALTSDFQANNNSVSPSVPIFINFLLSTCSMPVFCRSFMLMLFSSGTKRSAAEKSRKGIKMERQALPTIQCSQVKMALKTLTLTKRCVCYEGIIQPVVVVIFTPLLTSKQL